MAGACRAAAPGVCGRGAEAGAGAVSVDATFATWQPPAHVRAHSNVARDRRVLSRRESYEKQVRLTQSMQAEAEVASKSKARSRSASRGRGGGGEGGHAHRLTAEEVAELRGLRDAHLAAAASLRASEEERKRLERELAETRAARPLEGEGDGDRSFHFHERITQLERCATLDGRWTTAGLGSGCFPPPLRPIATWARQRQRQCTCY